MVIVCTRTFKKNFENLLKNNSYKSLGSSLIDFLSVMKIQDLAGGELLSANPNFPFLKDRIEGSSGYRIYLFLHYKTDQVILGSIHPKTGASGRANTSGVERKIILSEIIDGLKKDDLVKVTVLSGKIHFQD